MHAINPTIDRPERETVEAFKAFPAPVLSDVMDRNRRTMDAGVKPVFDDASVSGTALTVDAQAGDNLIIHRAIALAEAGDVLVIDADGHSEAGVWGELMSMTAQRRGIAGTVVDGGVRDVLDVSDLGYPLFSRHVSPKGSTKSLPGSINVPITCGGIVVDPGDIVVGDRDGLVVVPATEVEEVREAAEAKLGREAGVREAPDTPANYAEQFAEILGPLEHEDSDA